MSGGQKKDQNNVFDISQDIQRTRTRKRYKEYESFTKNHNISTEKKSIISVFKVIFAHWGASS